MNKNSKKCLVVFGPLRISEDPQSFKGKGPGDPFDLFPISKPDGHVAGYSPISPEYDLFYQNSVAFNMCNMLKCTNESFPGNVANVQSFFVKINLELVLHRGGATGGAGGATAPPKGFKKGKK